MSERLVQLGYDQIMTQCPTLPVALSRANPALMGAARDVVNNFERGAECRLFGAMQKYRNAVGTVLAMCKRLD